MKKIFFALAALMAFAFAGCEKDGSETDALTGTTWSSSYEGIPVELSFQKGGQATLNMDSERYVGTYTYNKPHVTIQMPIEGRNETFTGTYSDGALNISNSEYGSFVFVQTGGPSPDDKDENTDGPQGAAGKLLKQITHEDGECVYIEYDAQNRPTSIRKTRTHDEDRIYTFTYSGNTLTAKDSENPHYTLTATLNEEGYIISQTRSRSAKSVKHTYTYDNGMLQSAVRITEESDGFWEKATITCTWRDGNVIAAVKTCDEVKNESAWSPEACTYTYDTSVELAPSNLDLGYLFVEIFDELVGDDYHLGMLGFYGKSSKNPLTKASETVDDMSWDSTFSYTFNPDGTVATAFDETEFDRMKLEYYK